MQKYNAVKLNDKGSTYFRTRAFIFYNFRSVLVVE